MQAKAEQEAEAVRLSAAGDDESDDGRDDHVELRAEQEVADTIETVVEDRGGDAINSGEGVGMDSGSLTECVDADTSDAAADGIKSGKAAKEGMKQVCSKRYATHPLQLCGQIQMFSVSCHKGKCPRRNSGSEHICVWSG